MKSNPLIEKRYNADLTGGIEAAYLYDTSKKELLSRFYDHISEYYYITDMPTSKEFLIKTFLDD